MWTELVRQISSGSPMASLFPIFPELSAVPQIPGLSYLPEYITSQEELDLVAAIDGETWNTKWKRRRQPYGATYGKSDGAVKPMPVWVQFHVNRLLSQGISERQFNQMLVNEYLPGQGISLHRDYAPFGRTVASLSLLADCVMDLRRPTDDRHESILLERQSLLVLSDEARYEWEHGIAPRKPDQLQGNVIRRARRLSVTFPLLKCRGPSSMAS
jgi:alkylated DNA repair dioxygenase AlkB